MAQRVTPLVTVSVRDSARIRAVLAHSTNCVLLRHIWCSAQLCFHRHMASNEETVVEVDLGLYPDPAPLLHSWLKGTSTVSWSSMQSRSRGETSLPELLRSSDARSPGSATPNDEALPGHPLWGHGLDFYTISEVINSSWIAQLSQQNRMAFPDYTRPSKRHFIITFHDSTFECIADQLAGRIDDGSREAVFADVASSIR